MRFALLLLVACSSSPDIHINALCDTDAAIDASPDAPPDAAPDASPDAPAPGVDLAAPWQRRTILQGVAANVTGADGVDLRDINGDGLLDLASGWEQSSKTTVHIHPGCALAETEWPYVVLPGTVSGVEDATFGDVDADGRQDVVSAGSSGFRLYVHFGPVASSQLTASAWTQMTIGAATNVQRWLRAIVADINGDGQPDIVAGGYSTGATIDLFTSPTPRIASSWTRTVLSEVGATYTLEARDWDGDGDLDVLVSDRDPAGKMIDADGDGDLELVTRSDLRGSRVLINPGPTGGQWTNQTIANVSNMKWIDAPATSLIVDGQSSTATANITTIRTRTGSVWSAQVIPQPANVGQYNAARIGDIDADGLDDLVLVYSHAPGSLSGVVWLKQGRDIAGAPTWDRGEISGPLGEKWDNVDLYDVDCDGDLDVVANEQGAAGSTPLADKLGNHWFENPRIP